MRHILLFILLGGNLVMAVPYSDRPAPEKVEPRKLSESGVSSPAGWASGKEGSVSFIAEMMAFYPNDQLYFLARDGEYIYDLAITLNEDDPRALARMHLLNVSRPIVDNHKQEAVQYLQQEGIPSKLGSGRAILVDTGWRGKIPRAIKQLLGANASKIEAHFITSQLGNGIPSSRVFLEQLTKQVNTSQPDAHHTELVQFEHLPHFTGIADSFVKEGSKLVPASSASGDQRTAKALMADIRYFGRRSSTKKAFREMLEDMTTLVQAARGERSITAQEIADRKARLSDNGAGHFLGDLAETFATSNRSQPQTPQWHTLLQQSNSLTGDANNIGKQSSNTKPPAKTPDVLFGVELRIGSTFTTPKGKKLKVLEELKGSGGLNKYIVEQADGTKYFLSIPEEIGKDGVGDLESHLQHIKDIDDASVKVAKVKESSSTKGFILQEFVSGTDGKQWYKTWKANGADQKDPGFVALAKMLEKLINGKKYVGDLRMENMIFDGKRWHLIWTGAVQDKKVSESFERYSQKFTKRWGKDLSDALTSYFKSCQCLLGRI